jgi:hypothetical protein
MSPMILGTTSLITINTLSILWPSSITRILTALVMHFKAMPLRRSLNAQCQVSSHATGGGDPAALMACTRRDDGRSTPAPETTSQTQPESMGAMWVGSIASISRKHHNPLANLRRCTWLLSVLAHALRWPTKNARRIDQYPCRKTGQSLCVEPCSSSLMFSLGVEFTLQVRRAQLAFLAEQAGCP